MMSYIRLSAVLVLSVALTTASGHNIKLGYISSYSDCSLGGAAISLALDRATEEGLLRNHSFSIIARTNGCDPAEAMADAIELVLKERTRVVFGPYCSPACIAIGYFFRYYDTAMFPSSCVDPDLDDKETYPTLVRCQPSYNMMGKAFLEIFKEFDWKVTIIFSQESSACHYGASAIYEEFEANNITVTEWTRLHDDTTDRLIEEKVRHIQNKARVVILCHTWPVMKKFILAADRLGMTTPEYTYLYYQMTPDHDTRQPFNSDVANLNETQYEREARKRILGVFKQVTGAYLSQGHLENFRATLIQRYAEPPWNRTLCEDDIPDDSMPIFMSLSDCAYLYLMIVDEIMAEGGDLNNGRLVATKSKNKQFNGYTGRVIINDNADRIPDYWMWSCEPEDILCEPFALIHLVDPVGVNLFHEAYWPTEDGKPPPDVPECGFNGDSCKRDNTVVIIVVSVLSVTILASVVIGFIIFKERQREKEVQMMTWEIKYEDIEFKRRIGSNSRFPSTGSVGSQNSSSQSESKETRTLVVGTYCQLSTQLGSYNGTLVAVKCLRKETIHLNRDILVELKTMKDMIHENINTFIGACTHPPHICAVMAYCAKGSLQDIIENDDIKLDWLFKSSLIHDLISGMTYLHNTPLRSHGNLTSANCLIDSRWVLKVSGYGLKHFSKGAVPKRLSEFKKYQKMLWTAPELLRLADRDRPIYGTRKGDVYSFGIILQEVIYRSKPFFDKLNPKEIITRVIQADPVPYRPELSGDVSSTDAQQGIQELMTQCWAELPTARPTFVEIKKRFNVINKGRRFNIMDNMVSMLESYANNLEGLIQQRTNELVEEKKKTDRLLYQMLPTLVADRLKRGLSVEPEMFDAVSIYFSDIVGFTSLASESTPMEVVTLLNDLYTTFDRNVEKYDVYKVETIGDAYMVVSGLPKRNGNRHITEIADLALDLLNEVLSFKIRHKPDRELQLRIGLHTGPCAAGVVGKTMPRYCLFGDTVNMASRMESTGEAQKIHISAAAKAQLSKYKKYICVYRGKTPVKDKGIIDTYWLMPGTSGGPKSVDD